ncbi:MAG TPA: hypothetical protein VJ953_22790 [Saprospiraceae bacterium]|nr:hypothetical protein [Saprospiraceae bacterium]
MKKIILLFIASLFYFSGPLVAQFTNQGNFLAGATLGFSSSSSDIQFLKTDTEAEGQGPASLQINFAPNIGYFLMDELALGLSMDFTFSRLKEPSTDRTEDSNLLFGPFVRYYFPLDDDLAFFTEVSFGFGNSSDDLFIGGQKQSINTTIFATGFGPGFTIFASNGIGIEAIFKYNYARSRFNTLLDGINQETITRTNQFDISLGVQYYFSGVRPVILNR